MAEIDQTLWMIQFFFGKWNLFDKVSNCSNSRSYHFKSENWGPSKSCSLIEIFEDHPISELYQIQLHFLDPPCRPAGPMKPAPSVCLSVSQSVTKVLILPTIIFLRFFASRYSLMSLEKWRSPISKKKNVSPNCFTFVSKIEVFCHFLEIAALDFA